MNIQVAGSPKDENMLDVYEFRFCAEVMQATLCGFRQHVRESETAPWIESRVWLYPDIQGKSDADKPEVAEWVLTELRANIIQKIIIKL